MGGKLVRELEKSTTEGQCRHHWIIEYPEGPVSRGVCRRCGAEREFLNHLEYSRWDEESLPGLQGSPPLDTEPECELAGASRE